MVSIVSTAQAGLIDEDAYSRKRLRANSRSCGTWGTAFCCMNLRKSVAFITAIYAAIYLFNKLLLFILFSVARSESQRFQLQLMNIELNMDDMLSVCINLISNYFTENFDFIKDTYTCSTLNNYLELSSYVLGTIFFVGLLLALLGWFWLTATLLGLIWLDFVRSISAMFFFLFLFIRKTHLNIKLLFIVFIPMLAISLVFHYYSIQVVYSLYLVQLAGGKGNEYLSYFRLRRVIQNKKQITKATEYNYAEKNRSNEVASLIRKQELESDV